MQAPPYSFLVNIEIQEKEDGTWTVKFKFYPIVTDNKALEYNVKPVNDWSNFYTNLINLDKKQYIKHDLLNQLELKRRPAKSVRNFQR